MQQCCDQQRPASSSLSACRTQTCRGRSVLGPVDGALAEQVDALGQGVALPCGTVPACKDDGLQGAINLWQGHLHSSSCEHDSQSCAATESQRVWVTGRGMHVVLLQNHRQRRLWDCHDSACSAKRGRFELNSVYKECRKIRQQHSGHTGQANRASLSTAWRLSSHEACLAFPYLHQHRHMLRLRFRATCRLGCKSAQCAAAWHSSTAG